MGKTLDSVTKTEYYFNRETNKTVWSLPADDDEDMWISAIDPSTNKTYYINPQTNKTTWEKPTRVSSHSVVVPAKKPSVAASFRQTFFGRKKKEPNAVSPPPTLQELHGAASGRIEADGIVQGWLWKKDDDGSFERAYFALQLDGRLCSYASAEDFKAGASPANAVAITSASSVIFRRKRQLSTATLRLQ